ncbi:MAG: TM1812 family CRISPR-associated protein [Selenomonadaceae bacterium]|nr:TM1812 family CRISPR-associated protein [Selenomonadaceae bacterium]
MKKPSRKNIMIAFVSLVSRLTETTYPNIQGREYHGVQTNEAAIVKAQRTLQQQGMELDQIFLIASDAVNESCIPAGSEFGSVSHLEYLEKRLLKEDATFTGHFTPLPYHDSENIDDTLRDITKIAAGIQDYQIANSTDEIYVYADLTGGHRYSTMMLLAILQLLQHSDIKLGCIYYTDFQKQNVYDATSLERIFKLVSGADEFVQFGSVNSLMDYFSETTTDLSDPLTDLLESMSTFSNAIKICRTGAIKSDLQGLRLRLKNFRQHHGDGLEESLFATMMDTIEKEYGNLLQENVTDSDVIRWCVQKGFLQQAMILCTEWLPSNIVASNIAYTDDSSVMLSCQQHGANVGKSWQCFFISNYDENIGQKASASTHLDQLKADFFSALEGRKIPEQTSIKEFPIMIEFLHQFAQADADLTRLQINMMDKADLKQRKPLLWKALCFAYDKNNRNPNYHKSFEQFIKAETYTNLRNNILQGGSFEEFFELKPAPLLQGKNKQTNDTNVPSMNNATKWERLKARYESLYRTGTLKSKCRFNDMLDILHDYFLLRSERNQINHANAEDTMTTQEISTLIERVLNKIDDFSRP